MEIRPARQEDVAAWLELAREVEPLFGPMVEDPVFREALYTAVNDGRAVCAVEGERLCGAAAVSRDENALAWLAVASDRRGTGLGRALAEAALELLDASRPASVETFAPETAEGEAARRLFLSLGFEDRERRGTNPAGFPTWRMERPAAPEEPGEMEEQE